MGSVRFRGSSRTSWLAIVVLSIVAAACSDDGEADSGAAVETSSSTSSSTSTSSTSTTTTVTTTTVVDFFFEDGGLDGDAVSAADPSGRGYAVSTSHPLATETGMEVLADGGSAVDAAVAIQAVLGLVEPQSSGIGGGAFMLRYDARSETVTAYDGREEAPAGATPNMFVVGGVPLDPEIAAGSGVAVGSPGTVAMLALAHAEHGDTAWSKVLEPAILHARLGVEVSASLEDALVFASGAGASQGLLDLYSGPDGNLLTEGDPLVNFAYADTLVAIAGDWRAMYEGEVASAIVAATRAEPRPGSLTAADLAGYEARSVESVCRSYREWNLCGAPPPAGGVGVLSLMGQLEEVGIDRLGPSAIGWHLFIEASQRAHADHDAYLADDRVVPVPVDELLDESYLAARGAEIDPTAASPAVGPGTIAGVPRGVDSTVEAGDGSHVIVVDAEGNVVTMSSSVNAVFGSRRVAAGFVLNSQLTDFAFVPTGAGGPVANAVGPGKRPRSSMAPTIVLDTGGDVRLAVGSQGGDAAIAYVAKTLVGVLDWDLSVVEAVELQNVVARSGGVDVEVPPASLALLGALEGLGHVVVPTLVEESGIQVVEIARDGSIQGESDPRRDGRFESSTR